MGVLLGLASAITYGAADFMGGFVTRRTGVFSVVVGSQIFGSALLAAVLPFFLEGSPDTRSLVMGGLAGLAGAGGVGLFYKGLSIGRMSVVAPTTAVLGACFPVAFGLFTGERPTALALLGVGFALIAVALISSTPDVVVEEGHQQPPSGSGFWHSLGAGLGFGLFFIFLGDAGVDSGLWPLVAARVASVTSMALLAMVLGHSLRPNKGTIKGIAAAGILDVTANIFFVLSTRHGLLSIVAVVTSMYPASTVLLARVVLKERLHRLQIGGLCVAAAGLGLIAGS